MASNTPNLNLLKKDPATDGNDTFNIQTMLNDNWDKIDTAFANVPEQIKELTQAAITYKKIPAGISSINELTEIGIYFTPDLSTLTDTPLNPVEGNWTGAHAIINVYNVMPPYAGASFLRIVELYITYGTTKQYYFRRNTKISISGSNTTITHASWERMITSTGGTINGDMVINGTTQTKGPLQAYGDGADALALIGKTHNYISFYPQGVNAGRQGYFGFPTSGSKEFNINATDVLRFSDKSNAITLAEITGMAYQGNVPAPSLELGYNRTNSGPSFVDFHSTPGRDNDGRILVDADRTMFLEAKMISFTDQWRTYTLNGIYDDIQSVKQSGVNVKARLAAAINAKSVGTAADASFDTLVNNISQIKTLTISGTPNVNSNNIGKDGNGNYLYQLSNNTTVDWTFTLPNVNFVPSYASLNIGNILCIYSDGRSNGAGVVYPPTNFISSTDNGNAGLSFAIVSLSQGAITLRVTSASKYYSSFRFYLGQFTAIGL